jgi:hypothetical protein
VGRGGGVLQGRQAQIRTGGNGVWVLARIAALFGVSVVMLPSRNMTADRMCNMSLSVIMKPSET